MESPRLLTVLGATGFIGSHLVQEARAAREPVFAPTRDQDLTGLALGDVVYCIGLTADFRSRPFDTVEAHVCKLLHVVQHCEFDSLTYLSSTRVYQYQSLDQVAGEEDSVRVNSQLASDLYNISKLMGEATALACTKRVHVARLSNVYGEDIGSENFLTAIVKEALGQNKIYLHTSLDSAKDFVSIRDVGRILLQIARSGRQRVYNVASGVNVTNRDLTQAVAAATGCRVEVAPAAPTVRFPLIKTERIRSDFGFVPARLLDDIDKLVQAYKNSL